VGDTLGKLMLGILVGENDGLDSVGRYVYPVTVGALEGFVEGRREGILDGNAVGFSEGNEEGAVEGME